MFLLCLLTTNACTPEPDRYVRLTVDAGVKLHAISPGIFGTNTAQIAPREPPGRFSLRRFGGNRWTAYNWKNNASNAGADWKHQNDGYLSESTEPAAAVLEPLQRLRTASGLEAALVTVPIVSFVAADRKGDGDVRNSGPDYLKRRFVPNAPTFQQGFVERLARQFPPQRGVPVYYSLDNEPDLWSQTHPRVHPHKATYAEIVERNAEFAAMIKRAAPKSLVFGPAVSGWMGLTRLGEAPDAANRDFTRYYLSEMKRRSDERGVRLVDVFDFHWYPEHRGGGERVTVDASSPAVADARVQAPRSLYDPDFREDSWIVHDVLKEPISLLPRLDSIRAETDPKIQFAVTEYYFGGGADVSGAVAQADALGAFTRFPGLFAANLYHLGDTDDRFIHAAFDLFRNYDGAGGRFGEFSLAAKSDDLAVCSIYAAVHEPSGKTTVVLCHRPTTPTVVDVSLAGRRTASARRFVISAESPSIRELQKLEGADGKFRLTLSGRGVTLLEFATTN